MSERKIVAIQATACGHTNATIIHTVLADDGTAWVSDPGGEKPWLQIPSLPAIEARNDDLPF